MDVADTSKLRRVWQAGRNKNGKAKSGEGDEEERKAKAREATQARVASSVGSVGSMATSPKAVEKAPTSTDSQRKRE